MSDKKMRVVFMGTPAFAVPTLTMLSENENFSVEAVITQPDKRRGRGKKLSPTPVKEKALSLNIPVYQPIKAREPENVALLKEIAPDYLVVVAYGQILPLSILGVPKALPINLHASLLPRWRGAAPIQRAFLAGDKETGVCAMVMEEGLDTGPVLSSVSTPITDDDRLDTLSERLSNIGANLIVDTLIAHRDGFATETPQPEDGVTYAAKLANEDFVIDWSQSADMVSRKIRGLSSRPGAVTSVKSKVVKLLFAKACEGSGKPGEVLDVSKSGITVACGKNALTITEIKPEGKGAMDAYSFTLGYPINRSDLFV